MMIGRLSLSFAAVAPVRQVLLSSFSFEYVRAFEYSHKCVFDDFPEGLETGEITKSLCSVGFASPPDWLKSYDCLSQGEKMRVDIARALCLDKPVIVFDEFTSVVDREIANSLVCFSVWANNAIFLVWAV
jgi:ABC-type dipeptide/oligopeptide/nickel transport system ATPase subunit